MPAPGPVGWVRLSSGAGDCACSRRNAGETDRQTGRLRVKPSLAPKDAVSQALQHGFSVVLSPPSLTS